MTVLTAGSAKAQAHISATSSRAVMARGEKKKRTYYHAVKATLKYADVAFIHGPIGLIIRAATNRHPGAE